MKLMMTTLIVLMAASPVLAAEAEGGANPFAGTIYQSVAAIIVFLLLLVLLKRYAWGPILTGLQDREAKIREDLETAERARREAQTQLQAYETRLAEAQQESARIIEQGRSDAQKVAAQLKADTEREIRHLKERAQTELRSAKEQALSELYAQAATLATDVAGRILQREIRPEDQQRLVNESLEELRRSDGQAARTRN